MDSSCKCIFISEILWSAGTPVTSGYAGEYVVPIRAREKKKVMNFVKTRQLYIDVTVQDS